MCRFSRFLRSGSPNFCHCETPLYAAGGQIFILRTLIWGTRGVKGKDHCAISVVPTLAQKDAQEWGTPAYGSISKPLSRVQKSHLSTPKLFVLIACIKFSTGRLESASYAGGAMKQFLEILTNIRIATGEVGGTVSLIFLVAYGMYEAWHAFILPLFRWNP